MRTTLLGAALFCIVVAAPAAGAQEAAALQARHAALRESLARNPFGRPLHLESSEKGGNLKGEIYARVEQPFAVVGPALRGTDRWCDILILHPNVKGCRAAGPRGKTLSLRVGRKFDQPLADAYGFDFTYEVAASTPDYLRVVLRAAEGPLGTSRYRIVLEVAQLDDGRSFLHLTYAYTHGLASRWATRLYLATAGRSKIGFSIVGRTAEGKPVYIGSTRGVVERNAMRCYLAIEAYLGALTLSAPEQVEKRLRDWHAGVEQYAAQLHELGLDEYLAMKRVEIRRQQAWTLSASAQNNSLRGATLDEASAPGATLRAADTTRSAP